MVREAIKETGRSHGVITRVAIQLSVGSETARGWTRQSADRWPGTIADMDKIGRAHV